MIWHRRGHLSDAELLLYLEGALSGRTRVRAQGHVAACTVCARRARQLAEAEAGLTTTWRTEREVAPAFAEPPEQARPVRSWLVQPAWLVLLVLVAIGGLRLVGPVGDPSTTDDLVLPHPDLTPGQARAISLGQVCGDEPLRLGPPIAASVPRQVFEAYGADYRRAEDYELDFLVTPELGGTTDIANLWPQPFESVEWNAYVKDELEAYLREMVCDGTLDLATAQRHLATDWVAAYKRFFNTERPRRSYDRRPMGARAEEIRLSEALEARLRPVG